MIEKKHISSESLDLEIEQNSIQNLLRKASKKIAPVWPLERFVAVNPYLGMTEKSFDSVALELAAIRGIQTTLPSYFYLQKIEEGKLKPEFIAEVLSKRKNNTTVEAFLENVKRKEHSEDDLSHILTVAEVAGNVTQKDWKRFMTGRISSWAASYFNSGQAIWTTANQDKSLFNSWKEEAELDLSPEITGLKKFRKTIKSFPDQPLEAAKIALSHLNISNDALDIYLHCLLMRMGGWSAYASRIDWDNELYGGKDGALIEFLAVLLCWEAAVLKCVQHDEMDEEWEEALKVISTVNAQNILNEQLTQKLILQEAFDLTAQQEIINKFQTRKELKKETKKRVKAQAVFCIDVRSEVYRRNLELTDNEFETLGFAGFFAFPIKYIPLAHIEGEAQCPVLLKTGPTIMEEMPNEEDNHRAVESRIGHRQFQQIWKSFKSGAVTCFSYVSPIGLSYLPKLFTDSFGWTRPITHPDDYGLNKKYSNNKRISLKQEKHNNENVGIPLDEQIQMAKNALTAMSLKEDFAKFVLIMGHGSTMVNNPHATGYDCGACGGHTGEANARVAAEVLNNKEVREGLQKEGIYIPVNTIFLACLHDTTTDEISIYNEYDIPTERGRELSSLKKTLKTAGERARIERRLRLGISEKSNVDKSILSRSKDWSQTRPEWGLANCSAFVVAPRQRTKNINFEGRSFLHSYDWKSDKSFGVLELIMTAPMVVTSWISLQYFASTVDNKVFGSGNKTLHNVTAGVGVLEGFSGDLRVGLPLQAVHDGEKYQHEPVKLNVIIEAPIEAMNSILEKHKAVRDLCENGWIHLLAMDENGSVSHRYKKDFNWDSIEQMAA